MDLRLFAYTILYLLYFITHISPHLNFMTYGYLVVGFTTKIFHDASIVIS